ncbi:MAG: hypothetical protein A3I66_04755 [Burkholderiales bacterium RIFCSPLOWO2_02_FULL_57_36]|nr:MAG: hypothetical protein A3I66_04755 [Burkholderiales bacterium RIFCSPLOWO2_02_FULL_57_36]
MIVANPTLAAEKLSNEPFRFARSLAKLWPDSRFESYSIESTAAWGRTHDLSDHAWLRNMALRAGIRFLEFRVAGDILD